MRWFLPARSLLPAQALGDHYALALCGTLAPFPRAASAGQPAGVGPWSIERKAAGSWNGVLHPVGAAIKPVYAQMTDGQLFEGDHRIPGR